MKTAIILLVLSTLSTVASAQSVTEHKTAMLFGCVETSEGAECVFATSRDPSSTFTVKMYSLAGVEGAEKGFIGYVETTGIECFKTIATLYYNDKNEWFYRQDRQRGALYYHRACEFAKSIVTKNVLIWRAFNIN